MPCNLAQKVIRDLREFGSVQRAFLGVSIEDLDSQTAREIGLPNAEGVYVTRVSMSSAAADAGLETGDVIIGLDNTRIRSTPELQEYIGRYRPGEKVSLEYWRRGRKIKSEVTLKDSSNSTSSQSARARGAEIEESLGLGIRDLSKDEKNRMRYQGAIASSIRRGSIVYDTNMQPGFIITSVNGNRISDASSAIDAIVNAYNGIVLDGYYEGEPDLYSYRFRKRM